MINLYAYEFNLFENMKIHFIFHVSLLLFSKHDSVRWQMSESLSVIVKSEEDSYFVDLINNIKWQIQEAWFELLIKWEEYEWKIWESYIIIKKDAFVLIKEFHQDHFSWSVSIEWVKEKNW